VYLLFKIASCNTYSLSMFLFWVVCQTHHFCIFICHCLEILLFYSDCMLRNTYYYPDHFHWCLPLFNHITSRVMWYCSFATWSQFNCSFTPTRLCLYFTNTSLICNCLFPPCLCFAFAIAHLWAVFFILAMLVVFTWSSCCLSILYRASIPCLLLPALVFIHVPRLI